MFKPLRSGGFLHRLENNVATRKKQDTDDVGGIALVDIPQVGAKCGQWIELPADQAKAFEDAGMFDPKAKKPE